MTSDRDLTSLFDPEETDLTTIERALTRLDGLRDPDATGEYDIRVLASLLVECGKLELEPLTSKTYTIPPNDPGE